ncbi:MULTISPECIES: class II aldolase/adducin family protein [unclassified Streptomyces]|uniref:class II aldolase/adducin family protein n=1 Tax=unclassified Streptomyces TaxID=2593676 RepID=UPI0034198A5D
MATDLTNPEVRTAIVDSAQALFTNGVISRSGHANLSARVDGESMLLTVEGHVRDLGPDGLALVRLDGAVLEGKLDPANAEIVTMHSEVYRARPEVGGIVHTHAPHLLAFAMAGRPLPCRYEALLRFGQAEDVPVVPWAPRGSERSVAAIIDVLGQNPGTQAVLLGNHGVLVFGRGPLEAARLLTVLEEAAEAELAAEPLGGAASLPAGALEDIRASILRARS